MLQVAGNDDGVTAFQMDIKVAYCSFNHDCFFSCSFKFLLDVIRFFQFVCTESKIFQPYILCFIDHLS